MLDCLIVGGGIMGMLSALRLADAGCKVCVVERGELGRESSWAGGGIVSPLYPWRYAHPVSVLAHWSQASYPVLGLRLMSLSGIDPEVYATGLYWLDLDDHEQALSWASGLGVGLQVSPIGQVYQEVPALARAFQRALWMPGAANVRNPRLLKALRHALGAHPRVDLQEHCEVQHLLIQAGRCVGLSTTQGSFYAQRTVVAGGAWSARWLTHLGHDLPVEPVKGQMILYKCADDFLPSIVLAKGRYAIPRRDGHILVGSTLEHAGFDKTPTEEALASLKASAEELLPGLADAEVVGHWAGLRPGSPEGIPFIGEVPEYPGLWLNCGHYRNGLVLAPASCELLKNLMLDEVPIIDPAPYAPAGRLGRL
ncbi:FAD-dependent oxidoreductase [Pseudomonas sp. GOM6]|uniref:NAD(P)/FAD-dependent oxidoreductase n=1 Tax=Pseudomonas sp. GOM6 TaxID=3036944 RepID=UPI00240A0B3A|nr:FAD-dependent oxidoreductase [Pseudomonas sp. GOM6]MDG1582085.1 FAD-dependent oxidoreductase [Pseudomonas sp. GOM6]